MSFDHLRLRRMAPEAAKTAQEASRRPPNRAQSACVHAIHFGTPLTRFLALQGPCIPILPQARGGPSSEPLLGPAEAAGRRGGRAFRSVSSSPISPLRQSEQSYGELV